MLRFPLPRVVLSFLALLLLAAVARSAPAAAAIPELKTESELRAWLEARVTQPRFSSALWGVKVVSLDSGRVWFDHHADRMMSPASNTKLYAGALALDVLGSDYRIRTPLLATAAPDVAGEIKGDLIVSGRGDPSWRSRGTGKDFWESFAPVVKALTAAGVRRVSGDLVADASWFQSLPHGAGWTADDLNDYYGAEISAITLEQNYAEVRLTPAAQAGGAAVAVLAQPHTGLLLDNRVVTGAAGSAKRITAQRVFGERTVYLWGELPLGSKIETVDVTVPRPAAWFAAGLKEALERGGIHVAGRARSVRWPEPPAVRPGCVTVGEVVSPPLATLVAAFMKPSQNLETDLIFGHVGELRRTPDRRPWESTEDLALAALREFLERNGLPADEVRFEEGSGLSRNNLTSANATVALLCLMATHRAAADFLAALPIAGVDGSLRQRMKGTPAEGNVRAKTGTLRYANSLAGYVTTAAGEKLAFCLMLNRQGRPPAGRSVREDLDELAVALAAYRGGP